MKKGIYHRQIPNKIVSCLGPNAPSVKGNQSYMKTADCQCLGGCNRLKNQIVESVKNATLRILSLISDILLPPQCT